MILSLVLFSLVFLFPIQFFDNFTKSEHGNIILKLPFQYFLMNVNIEELIQSCLNNFFFKRFRSNVIYYYISYFRSSCTHNVSFILFRKNTLNLIFLLLLDDFAFWNNIEPQSTSMLVKVNKSVLKMLHIFVWKQSFLGWRICCSMKFCFLNYKLIFKFTFLRWTFQIVKDRSFYLFKKESYLLNSITEFIFAFHWKKNKSCDVTVSHIIKRWRQWIITHLL